MRQNGLRQHLRLNKDFIDTVCTKSQMIEIIFTFFVVFLLFEEPAEGVTIPTDAAKAKAAERNNWDVMKFASEYHLKLVGVNYFETKNPVQ